MGRDKATIGGPDDPWAARVHRAVRRAGVADVVLVGGRAAALALFAPCIPDDAPGSGPAAAAATLGRFRPGRHLLVVACDLPDLTGPALRPLLDAVEAGAPVAVPIVDRRPAWSVTALSVDAVPHLRDAVALGVRSFHGCLDRLDVEYLQLPEAPFRDVDGP